MVILLASLNYKPHQGGIENSFFYMAKEFKTLGHDVVIMASDKPPGGDGRLPEYEKIDGIDVFRFKRIQANLPLSKLLINIFDIFKSFSKIKRLNSQFRFNLAVLRNESVGLGAVFALKETETFYILPAIRSKQDRVLKNDFSGNRLIRQLRYLIYEYLFLKQADFFQRFLIQTAHKSFVFSRNMQEQVSLIAPKSASGIHLVKPGVDISVFSPGDNKKQYREKLGIPFGAYVFLIVGRIVKVKGIDIAIKAFYKLDYPNAMLLIVGDGPEIPALGKLSAEIGVKDKVLFFPSTKEPESFFKAADAFLMSSTYEPFGQTILEAMASGLPVIGFKNDSHCVMTATDEIVEDKKNGFLCNFGVEPLSEALARCTSLSAEKNNSIKKRNREKIESEFSWVNLCNELLRMYK
jgi:1,2-diacylglycerol 3-alpha-glucosyltransferase